jgi:hypothetical protein
MLTLVGYASVLAARLGYFLGAVQDQGETHYVLVTFQSHFYIAYKSLDDVLNFLAIKQEMSS